MMMAFNRDQPPSPALSDETVAALRTALARYVNDGDLTPALHDALCGAAQEARAKGILAERLLIVLKQAWHAIPDVRDSYGETTHDQAVRLQRLITRCIEAYYE